MGQGEPGLNYPAVKQSILLTDCAMSMIDQIVSRYIVSTCGISELCDVNKKSIGKQSPLRNEDAKKLCEVFSSMGFEGKTFSSFGDSEIMCKGNY